MISVAAGRRDTIRIRQYCPIGPAPVPAADHRRR
jgi:hypothetical protein